MMSKYDSVPLAFFYESYTYKGYGLVNELYEDDDVRKNNWMLGKLDGDNIVDAVPLDGLSSNSYAPFKEVIDRFYQAVDNLM